MRQPLPPHERLPPRWARLAAYAVVIGPYLAGLAGCIYAGYVVGTQTLPHGLLAARLCGFLVAVACALLWTEAYRDGMAALVRRLRRLRR